MKIERAASIPLMLHDPYFSIWSPADRLYDKDPEHWSGIRQQLRGYVTIDGKTSCFLGNPEFHPVIPQKSVDVTSLSTEYCFENDRIILTVRFTSPLLPDDLTLMSRPCSYVDLTVEKKTPCEVSLELLVSADLVGAEKDPLVGGAYHRPAKCGQAAYSYASMGRAFQHPLGNSGDNITIDWGYVYLACAEPEAVMRYDNANRYLRASLAFSEEKAQKSVVLAYDDLLSINYFGEWRKAYWTGCYETIQDAIGAALFDRGEVLERAARLDREIEEKARALGGEDYAFLCAMSFRHAIAAHKLVTDEHGELLFLSKENDSNGCIGTVDVSYPSVPLFLLYNTEYVKGMLRPVFRFAASSAWEFDFAPHDVGRYPYAWGQVYGLNWKEGAEEYSGAQGAVYPPFWQYPSGSGIYDLRYQMPVEECGNMLIMTAVVCMLDGSAAFAHPHRELLKKWTGYLLTYGSDPGEQLCTDDFAGHLSHNVNLSAKAILGVEAYAQLAAMWGCGEEAKKYHAKAAEMANSWEKRADAGDHCMLAFGSPESWSLKYNLVWDCFFGSRLFQDAVYEKELAWYETKTNTYGVPLDNRAEYTKSDWILWCAAMAGSREQAEQLIAPVASYLRETSSRVPFSDWYETVNGAFCHFKARSVQGGLFMPILMAEKGRAARRK